MISIYNLEKYFDTQKVLAIDTLHIRKKECIALIGNNGAGKTTLIKSIVDLIKLDKGEVHIHGKNVAQNEEWKKK